MFCPWAVLLGIVLTNQIQISWMCYNYYIRDCLSKNFPDFHLAVFQEISFLKHSFRENLPHLHISRVNWLSIRRMVGNRVVKESRIKVCAITKTWLPWVYIHITMELVNTFTETQLTALIVLSYWFLLDHYWICTTPAWYWEIW